MPNGETNGVPQEGTTEQQAAPSADALAGLPEEFKWLAKEVTTARNEAARYRTERNDLRKSLEGAVTVEDFEAAKSEWDGKVKTLVRQQIIKDHKLPDDLAELLKGDDEASLAEHAAKLAKYVPKEPEASAVEPAVEPEAPTPPPLPPVGGRDPGASADDVEPADLVKLAKSQNFH
ncbi:hypothetical protein J2X12_002887 [Pseudarthrobacter oxydans]|uniref:Scaffolding protein n=1 Tax=Pseudarthrobacter oxydans TaxID=1671 RepID=A0AAW8NEN5_PSEOX|nr:hypothetical protein [Pseudarthrobacter oxydans]MDR6794376.1 hypothetical protein [Pseudarthrobacter oxydans]MDR7164849.1 hypothetical protein [Pseudarthrobacter oxydans]